MKRTIVQALRRRPWPHPPQMALSLAGVVLALILGVVLLVQGAGQLSAGPVNVLTNGDFEDGFQSQPGCGMVAKGWRCFTNGGAAVYGFYDDMWQPVVASGAHSQLIEINTWDVLPADHDRYAGIYQTVRVVDWTEYTLSLKGIIRTTELDGDPWRYRVQVGWTQGKEANWQAVTNWTDVGWDTYYPRTAPGGFSSFSTKFMAEDDYVTIYIRVWKKWGVPQMELDVNLDAVSLTGKPAGGQPAPTATPAPSTATPTPTPTSAPAEAVRCEGANQVANGDFEGGFNSVALGNVGKSWGYFTNGGAVHYQFSDDTWSPVVADGAHSQGIRMDTLGMAAGDTDRYAGIYQKISGLTKGATYELTIKGMLRGAGNDPDPYRYVAQWGFNAGDDTNWQNVDNWQIVHLGPIHPEGAPGGMATYTVRFTAPETTMVLFIRGWRKWGTPETVMLLNLDGISLRGCAKSASQPAPSPCVYAVKPGDTLSGIAAAYRVNLYQLMAQNGILNPNIIYVGQRLTIPGCAAEATPMPTVTAEPTPLPTPTPMPLETIYIVRYGDTLSGIAAAFGVDMAAIMRRNGITNPNIIYVGQRLIIPDP